MNVNRCFFLLALIIRAAQHAFWHIPEIFRVFDNAFPAKAATAIKQFVRSMN